MGGDDSPDNITPPISIALHAELHKDLYEHFGKTEDFLAWKGLLGESKHGIIFTDEVLQKMSRALKGKIPWNKGKKGIYSQNTLDKISNTLKEKYSKGILISPFSKNPNKPGCFSKEVILNLKENSMGENNPFYGKHHTLKTKILISESLKNKYVGNKSGLSHYWKIITIDEKIKYTSHLKLFCIENGWNYNSVKTSIGRNKPYKGNNIISLGKIKQCQI